MCVVSMIMDHYHDKWTPLVPIQPFIAPPMIVPPDQHIHIVQPISPAEIEEFRRLLERAREYDKKHNEPDCELEEKKERVRKLAEELGVVVDFL